MAQQQQLIELEQRPETDVPAAQPAGKLRLRRPNRRQLTYAAIDVELLVGDDNRVRAVWALSGKLDLSRFAATVASHEGAAGRAAWDPRLLVAIWIWAYSEGVSSAREIERQCVWRPELRWLCGLEIVNHHTLSDFRVAHAEALEDAFSQVAGLLSQAGLVDLEQVGVDGTRLRAQASSSSQRSRKTLENHIAEAREVARRLSAEAETDDAGARRQAAQRRAAREKVERLEAALGELQQRERESSEKDKQNKEKTLRVSANEPEARVQRESNGGYGLGYNAQLATDAAHKIVVGVQLSNNASDAQQLVGAVADVERRCGSAPKQVLADEGYTSRANIEAMEAAGIEFAAPAPEAAKRSQAAARAAGIAAGYESEFFVYDERTNTFRCPQGERLKQRGGSQKRGRQYQLYRADRGVCAGCEQRLRCCPKSFEKGRTVHRAEEDATLERHREWMQSERAKASYRRRAETAEFPNAWIKERFGVRKFRVRGLIKAKMELLWAVTAYNVRQWMRLVWFQPATATI